MNVAELFGEEKIRYFSVIPFELCSVTRRYLIDREKDFTPRSAICFAVPYYTGDGINLSAYAVSCDYHLYMRGLFERICPALQRGYPTYRFFGFSDHSPVDERNAAAVAGIGVIGENGMLITEDYSSYVFLGEILTDAPPELLGATGNYGIKHCEGCGACRKSCPSYAAGADCLSMITQKKGELTDEEEQLMLDNGSVWGCDICQTVCPYTVKAKKSGSIYTDIDFFLENRTEKLDSDLILNMTDEDFSKRAYSWRGRNTVVRNLELFEKNKNIGKSKNK